MREDTNSFLYMPLFLVTVGELPEAEAHAWRQHPLSRDWWADAAAIMRAVPPVDGGALRAALATVEPWYPQARASAALVEANLLGATASLTDVVMLLADATGHIPSVVQDVLLQVYGDVGFSRELDSRADLFRDEGAFPLAPRQDETTGPIAATRLDGDERRPEEGGQQRPRLRLTIQGSNGRVPSAMQADLAVTTTEGSSARPRPVYPPAPNSDSDDTTSDEDEGGRDDEAEGHNDPVEAAVAPTRIPVEAWEALDGVNLREEMGRPVRTVQDVPVFMRAGVKQAFSLALAAMRAAYNPEGRRTTSHRGATTEGMEAVRANVAHALTENGRQGRRGQKRTLGKSQSVHGRALGCVAGRGQPTARDQYHRDIDRGRDA